MTIFIVGVAVALGTALAQFLFGLLAESKAPRFYRFWTSRRGLRVRYQILAGIGFAFALVVVVMALNEPSRDNRTFLYIFAAICGVGGFVSLIASYKAGRSD